LGSWACAGIIASFVDMAVRSTVPGANDNLTGVAVLVAVARALATDPIRGLRVVLLSTGSEESLMEGMEAFGRRHFPSLPPGRTVFVCVDTVGSPTLLLPEAEGMLHVRHYDERLKALITSAAAECGVEPPPGTPDATGH
jgi:Zn-dependent M28 family amino/carboxypeptidase